jgi:hypothetical protein
VIWVLKFSFNASRTRFPSPGKLFIHEAGKRCWIIFNLVGKKKEKEK